MSDEYSVHTNWQRASDDPRADPEYAHRMGRVRERQDELELLHQEHPEAWSVTAEERARWIGARVRINASNRPEHPWAGREGKVVGVWRGLAFAGCWHVVLDTGEQFGAFTGELDRQETSDL